MTIRLDEATKKEFARLCDEFGLSVNAAINVFIKAVINTGEIPFKIGKPHNDDITKKHSHRGPPSVNAPKQTLLLN